MGEAIAREGVRPRPAKPSIPWQVPRAERACSSSAPWCIPAPGDQARGLATQDPGSASPAAGADTLEWAQPAIPVAPITQWNDLSAVTFRHLPKALAGVSGD